MIWKEITVYTTSEASDLVADVFFSEGGNGVSIYDKKDIIDLYKSDIIWDYIDESLINNKDKTVLVKGFISSDCFNEKFKIITKKLDDLKQNIMFDCGSLETLIKDVNDSDWLEVWKKYYKPIYIGNLVICPVWIKIKDENKKIVYIDPGMAFGTGEHETTSMCLELMQHYTLDNKTVIDIGCGSGILGVSALKLGAAKAYMTDIDLQAIQASKNCSKLNLVSDRAEILKELPQLIKGDIILLNIVADILIGYAKTVKSLVNKGGKVILSGIIEKRLDDVIETYLKQGFTVDKMLKKGEWCAVSLY